MARLSSSTVTSLTTLWRHLLYQDKTKLITTTATIGGGIGATLAFYGSSTITPWDKLKPGSTFSWFTGTGFAAQADFQQQHKSDLSTFPHLPSIYLYQYEVCPFCCKVRAFLDYHKIPYEVVEVNPISKGELKWSTYKKVPVIKLGDEQVNDSNVIIETLAEKLRAAAKSTAENFYHSKEGDRPPLAADGSAEEKKWRAWVDDRLVRILTANIYRSLSESWETFQYIAKHGNFGAVSRYATRMFGTATMYIIGQRMPKKYQIEGDLRQALYTAVDEWIETIGNKPFLGGHKPNLGDLAVYGVIEAVHGTRTFDDMVTHTKIKDWHQRMTLAVGASSRINIINPSTKSTPSHLET